MYLLIWEENPNEIKFFALPADEVVAEEYTLHHAHNTMINSYNDEYALRIENFISQARPPYAFDGKWYQYQIPVDGLPKRGFDGVFKTGKLIT